MKRIQYLRKHMRTQRESTQLCENTTAVWERDLRSMKKLKLIDFSKESRLEELKEFFSSSVPLLSLLSSKATQWTLITVQDSFCFKVLKRWRTFAFSLKRCSACFTRSFIVILSSDFSWRWAQFRKSNDIDTHEQSWQIHSEHFAWPVIMIQEERTVKQWSQAMRKVKSKIAMIFTRWRQLCCLWEDMTMRKLFVFILLLI